MNETPQLLMIEWVDRSQPAPGWQRLSDIETRSGRSCVSVGFLVREDAQTKVIAPNLSTDGEGWDRASSLIAIPTASITKIRQISTLLTVAPKPSPRPLADAQWLRRLA